MLEFELMVGPAKKILMVRPSGFGYNPETAASNKFQRELPVSVSEISELATREFDEMAKRLLELEVDLVVIEDPEETTTPDAVFPNNWFSTHAGGTLCLYPMEAGARRLERNLSTQVLRSFKATRVVDLTGYERQGLYLEGTGSLVLDHNYRLAFACLSSRTNALVLDDWCGKMGFDAVAFNAFDGEGSEIYHTNVMMCLGDKYAIACVDSIEDEKEKAYFLAQIHHTERVLVEISHEQMSSFAGNMLQISTKMGDNLLLMSQTAFDSLNSSQRKTLESFDQLVPFSIDTIETCGGGSVRCMIAEIFE